MKDVMRGEKSGEWKLITLTWRHTKEPLADQIAKLKAHFRTLRQRKLWKNTITGGVAVIEIARNYQTGTWHPHFHMICRGKFIPQRQLSMAWVGITRGSKIVDVRPIKDKAGAAEYVSKYVTKAIDERLFEDKPALTEFLEAITKCRMIVKFGDVPAYQPDKHKETEAKDWTRICPLASALAESRAGNEYYVRMMNLLEGNTDDDFDPDDWQEEPATVPALQHDTG